MTPSKIFEMVMALPDDLRHQIVLDLVRHTCAQLPVSTVREMRAEILERFPQSVPIIGRTIALIDEHIAIRESAN